MVSDLEDLLLHQDVCILGVKFPLVYLGKLFEKHLFDGKLASYQMDYMVLKDLCNQFEELMAKNIVVYDLQCT